MKKWQIILIVFLVLALGGLGFYKLRSGKITKPNSSPSATPSISAQAKKEFTFDDKVALASYYGWYYKNPAWGELTNAEHPLAGSYDPSNEKTIDYQVTLASDLGLDGFLFSWNGINNANDKALLKMLEKIETTDKFSNFKIGALYENVNYIYKGPDQTFIDELSYLINMSKEHPAFLKINGLPVIFVYSPQLISTARWQEIMAAVKSTAGDAYWVAMPGTWDLSNDWLSLFQTITPYFDVNLGSTDLSKQYENLEKQGRPLIATLIGGTTRLQKMGVDIDRSGGQYLKSRYEIAKKNNANWLYITSWNEWYEFNQIEASRETAFESANYLREILANFKNTPLKDVSAVMTINRGASQTKIKNEGPSNIYYVRCGHTDKSLLLSLVMRPGEEQTYSYVCYNVNAYLANNKKLEY